MNKKYQEAQSAALKAQLAAAPKPAVATVAFDAWWAMNEKKIPVQHHKEIIAADFRARGLSMNETVQSYNDALKKYGLKLK